MFSSPSLLRFVVASLALVSQIASAQTPPPAAPVRDVTDTYYGVTVHDPYRYFEDTKDREVAAWIKAQADYTRAILDKVPQRKVLLEEINRFDQAAAARVTMVQVVGNRIYYLKRSATENIPKLYMRDGFQGKERLLVDPEGMKAPADKHYAIDYYQPSPDNRYVAYGISIGGSEESVLHVLDTATARETGDVIDRANFASPSWLPGGRLIYSRMQKLAPGAPVTDKYQFQKVYLHRLGMNPDDDTVLLGTGVSPVVVVKPTELVFVAHPIGSKYIIGAVVNGTQNEFQLYATPLALLNGDKTPWIKIAATEDDVTDARVIGDTLYLLTHKGASRFKVLRLLLGKPDMVTAQVVVPASEAVITGIAAAKDALYVRRMNGGISDLLRLAHGTGSKPESIELPFAGDVDSLTADPRMPGVVFESRAWTRFGGWFVYDAKSRKVVDTGLQPQGEYDNPMDLIAEELKAKARDGTMIPLSVVHKNGIRLDGDNPTILYGYGAYGLSRTPRFDPVFLSWFNRGGILAIAHVRGGGEYGEDWHRAGYKTTKPNTWNDAIACAEWLIAEKYTSPAKLAIRGRSAGGIFVGRSITDRPDLFAAAFDQVAAADMIRMETTANGVPNIPEFGSVKSEEGFKSLYAMSPYHWVKDGVSYPAVLISTGINDPRVDAWESAKLAARLQAASTSGKPVLLRIEYDAGHGFGSTKKQRYEEQADEFAFLFWQLGVREFQP